MGLFNFAKTEEEQGKLNAIDENFAVISFEPSGTIIHANANFLDALGYGLNEVIGNHHKMFCENSLINSKQYIDFWKNLNSGIAQINEFKRIKKDGSSIWIQASYTPVKNSSGKVVKIIKVAQDITERKLQNADYEGQLNAISKSQAVIEFSMDGTILKANENFLNTLGYKQSDVLGKKHSMFCEESYKSSNEYKQFWKKLNDGKFDTGEYLRIGNNSKNVWIQASYNPIFDIDGKPYKVVKYATDITSRKNMVIAVEKTSKQLLQSAQGLHENAQSMSQSAATTTAQSEEASVSIEKVSQGSQNVLDKISIMLDAINEITTSSQDGKKIANEVQLKSKETTTSMQKLSLESEKIGDVVGVISQIAFQTNILSLNAAVEAATAGEAGKGFSVVAGEVRNLASRSDEAAKEISKAITYIQELVTTSLDLITSIDSTIENMSGISETIVESVNEQSRISNEVSVIMRESSIGIKNI